MRYFFLFFVFVFSIEFNYSSNIHLQQGFFGNRFSRFFPRSNFLDCFHTLLISSQRYQSSTPLPLLETKFDIQAIKKTWLVNNHYKLPQNTQAYKLCQECFEGNVEAFAQAFSALSFNSELFLLACRFEKEKNVLRKLNHKKESRFLKRPSNHIILSDILKHNYYGDDESNLQSFFPINDSISFMSKFLEHIKNGQKTYQQGISNLPNFLYDMQKQLLRQQFLQLPDEWRDEFSGTVVQALRLENSYNSYDPKLVDEYFDSLQIFLGKNNTRRFLFSPIINGVYFKINYSCGYIRSAVVNGSDGEIDITALVRHIPSVPEVINDKKDVTFSGMLYFDAKDFQILNMDRVLQGKRSWIDPASAIFFAIRSSDPLKMFNYKIKACFDAHKHNKNHQTQNNIDYNKLPQALKPFQKIGTRDLFQQYLEQLQSFPFFCVGVEISALDPAEYVMLQKTNREAFYHYIMPSFHETTVHAINFKVHSTGVISTILNTEPLELDNKQLSVFTLSHYQDLEKLNIHEKDKILLYQYPGVDPQILVSLKGGDTVKKNNPKNCPQCSTILQFQEVENRSVPFCAAHLVCTSDTVQDIMHFISAQAINIPSLSEKIVQELVEKSIFTSIFDIFKLSSGDWINIEKVSMEDFKKILEEIHASRSTTLARFIFSLNIPLITYPLAEKLAYQFRDIQKFQKATIAQLLQVDILNKRVARSIFDFFALDANIKRIEKLLEYISISDMRNDLLDLCLKENYTKDEAQKLIDRIHESNQDSQKITDFEYDMLVETARRIQKSFPELQFDQKEQPKNHHAMTWEDSIHLKKTYNIDDLEKFFNSCPDGVVVMPKVDGIACSLVFKEGVLINAFTRSTTSNIGFDITGLIKKSKHIPHKIANDFTGIIRGELYLSKDNFSQVNQDRMNIGQETYIDSLSALVGLVKNGAMKESFVLPHIRFYGFHILETTSPNYLLNINYRSELFKFLIQQKLLGVLGAPKIFHSFESLKSYVSNEEARRHEFPTAIDGLVLGDFNFEDTTDDRQQKSYTPGLLAYKFKLEKIQSQVSNVVFSTGKNGIVSAILEIEPIRAHNGRMISRIHLKNIQHIQGLHEKDVVYLNYGGGIAPRLHSFDFKKRSKNAVPIQLPKACPSCHKKLTTIKETGSLKCNNELCIGNSDTKKLVRYAHHVNMGNDVNIKKLIEGGLIKQFSDFYRLIPEDLAESGLFTQHQTMKLLSTIDHSKSVSLRQFLYALNIPKVGKVSIDRLVKNIHTFEQLLDLAENNALKVPRDQYFLYPLIAYLRENEKEMKALLQFGVTKKNYDSQQTTKKLENRVFDVEEVLSEFHTLQASLIAATKNSLKEFEALFRQYDDLSEKLETMDSSMQIISVKDLLGKKKKQTQQFVIQPLHKFLEVSQQNKNP